MASIHLPRSLTQRKAGPVELEREQFEKSQTISISKAINILETPVKEKHVRSAIIGTYHVKGATLFWSVVGTLPIQGNHIACWKMCHTLHKILREGHALVIPDSQPYKYRLKELGKYWGHLRDSFGRLISAYCLLLVTKLDFHSRNPKFPGNMQITDEQLDNIVEMDINNFFQLSVEMFDYLEEILNLQAAVFGSMETGRANSMTTSGQCRLSPLIPCVQDSSHLYDYLVKLLFKLHSSLPPDVLLGHRERFYKQYKILRNFYQLARNLQYFKQLIQIPLMPDEPPNFLRMTDLSSHVSPVVVLPEQFDATDSDSIDIVPPNLMDAESSDGSASPELVSDKDRIIERLMQEIDELKMENQRIKIEGQRLLNDKHLVIAELESQLAELHRRLLANNQELERLVIKEAEMANDVGSAVKLVEAEKKAKTNEEKFVKMKDVYNKLRDEHVTLIRTKADLDKQLGNVRQSVQDVEKNKNVFDEKITSLNQEKDKLQNLVDSLQLDIAKHEDESRRSRNKLDDYRNNLEQESDEKCYSLLVSCIKEAEYIVKSALDELDHASSESVTCTPEHLLTTIVPLNTSIQKFKEDNEKFQKNQKDLEGLLQSICGLPYFISTFLNQGKVTTCSTMDTEHENQLLGSCRTLGTNTLRLLSSLKSKESISTASDHLEKLQADLDITRDLIESFIANAALKVDLQLSDIVEQELQDMDRVIEEATSRIADILSKSRNADTGIKLEVNGKILDSCTLLMQAIKVLVKRSKDLQIEIVAQGKGTASVKEFYKRNHRWTEGLISAAKAVGFGARFLVDAADKVVCGDAKLEELMVASQEIAASTAQLVVASKVKADRDSENMRYLSSASKEVSQATGNVLATVKSCAQIMDDSDIMDFNALTLHQAKRFEMDSQVKILELESNLVKEREKLASLRKRHYMLGGASEGWDEEVS